MTDEVEVHEIRMPDFSTMFARDEPPELDPETARELLTDALAVLDKQTKFKRGDIMKVKKGLDTSTHGGRGNVAIFIAYREAAYDILEPMNVGSPMSHLEADCIVGILGDDSGMREHFACSRYYELA